MRYTARVDFPEPALFPNKRHHWSVVSDARALQKSAAYLENIHAIDEVDFTEDDRLIMAIDFFFPDRRKRDFDGLLSAVKGAIDGVCRACGVDDSQVIEARVRKYPYSGGDSFVSIDLRKE